MKKLYFLFVVSVFCSAGVLAQPGTLDNTFGTGGKVGVIPNAADEMINAVAVQTDQKIVVAGNNIAASTSQFLVVRYKTDGTPDSTFGTNGRFKTFVNTGANENAYAVVIQGDTSIYVGGAAGDDFAVMKLRANGTLDTSWNHNGKVVTPFGSSKVGALSMAMQPDNKIVAAGFAKVGSKTYFALARYKTDGSLDTTFDADGKLTYHIGAAQQDSGIALVIQPDGKIIVGGISFNDNDNDFALVRLNANGSEDNTFGTEGKVTTDFVTNNDQLTSLALQSDGSIIAGGTASDGTSTFFALARYDSTGTLDAGFGGGGTGTVTTSFGTGYDLLNALTLQTDGSIVAAGSTNSPPGGSFALVRYTGAGVLDNSFGNGGKVTTAEGSAGGAANAVVMQADGKILAGGRTNNSLHRGFALNRYIGGGGTGITDISLLDGSSLFPNPVNEQATLKYNLHNAQHITIKLTDLQGRQLQTILNNVHQQSGSYTQSIPLQSGLASGVYMLTLTNDNGTVSWKIVK